MGKLFTALGLMSGTSGDGVDASVICSDGIDYYNEINNEYFEYDEKNIKIHCGQRSKISRFKNK